MIIWRYIKRGFRILYSVIPPTYCTEDDISACAAHAILDEHGIPSSNKRMPHPLYLNEPYLKTKDLQFKIRESPSKTRELYFNKTREAFHNKIPYTNEYFTQLKYFSSPLYFTQMFSLPQFRKMFILQLIIVNNYVFSSSTQKLYHLVF